VIVYPDTSKPLQLLSDDGTQLINGVPCKALKNPDQRSFRGMWVAPAASRMTGGGPPTLNSR